MADVVILKQAETTNLPAWLDKIHEQSMDATSVVVLAVRNVDSDTESICTIDYFNMDEYVYTWAAAKIGDSAAIMRGRMSREDY